MTLTRREFIKHSGIGGRDAGGDIGCTPLPAWAEEKGGKILTAGRWGAMNVEVKDGKIVSSTGALAKPYRTHYSLRRRIRYTPRRVFSIRW